MFFFHGSLTRSNPPFFHVVYGFDGFYVHGGINHKPLSVVMTATAAGAAAVAAAVLYNS